MREFFVSNVGNDDNDGLSPAKAFKTINKINSLASVNFFQAGDVIRFRKGDIFYGGIKIKDNPGEVERIVVTSFGRGKKPIICGYKNLSNSSLWTQHSQNIWQANLNDFTKVTGNVYSNDANVGFLKLDGKIHPYKKWSTAELTDQWHFYSDETTGYLYVYSTSIPTSLKTKIEVSVNETLLPFRHGVDYINLEVMGTGAHGTGREVINADIVNCDYHEIGGSRLTDSTTTRYGNGIEIWSNSKNVKVEGCNIWDVYDVAHTMQGHWLTIGWENIHFKGNKIWNCNQSFEFWSRGGDDPTVVPDGIGYKNCVIEDNIIINSGYAWSSEVRPDTLTKVDILMYEMYAKVVDITFRGNVFYDPNGSHIFTPDGTYIPSDLKSENNYVFMRPGTKIYSNMNYTIEQYLDFVEATGGLEKGTKFFILNSDDAEFKIDNILADIASYIGLNQSGSSVLEKTLKDTAGDIQQLKNASVSRMDFKVGGYVSDLSTVAGNGYAKMLTFRTINGYNRFNLSLAYSLVASDVIDHNGRGMLFLQIVPGTDLKSATIDLDVFDFYPSNFPELSASDFTAVVEKADGKELVVSVYYNIGKKTYLRLNYQPINIFTNSKDKSVGTYYFYNDAPLLASLPNGTKTNAKNTGAAYIAKPSTGNGTPTTLPSYVGEEYVDIVNRKVYKAAGINALSDWVVLN